MVDPARLSRSLTEALAPLGLQIMGSAPLSPEDGLTPFRSLALIGPDDAAFWPVFSTSPEADDGAPDPMDRWSRRVLTPLAKAFDGQALFPFGGAPYHPFYSWALRSGRFWASPIGFLVHAEAGLFASFRGALALRTVLDLPAAPRPCDSCAGQPCRSACPVGAFADVYDVDACKAHLHRPEGADCMALGCRARRACPVGQGRRLPAQSAFHMKAFR